MNHDSRFESEASKQPELVAFCQRDTPRRGRETLPRHMDENGAAPTGHARSDIMVDLDDEIVKTVGAPQAVAWFIGRPLECSVVAPVVWVFAPGVVRPYPPNRQKHTRAGQSVGPQPQPNRAKPADGCRAVTFPLRCLGAGSSQCDPEHPISGREPALAMPTRSAADMNDRERSSPHGRSLRLPIQNRSILRCGGFEVPMVLRHTHLRTSNPKTTLELLTC
jgi:hypothetical protein